MANFNPDDGVILGFVANYTVNNFIRDPFTQKHSLSANFYTATGGFNLGYKGIFKKAIAGWDAGIDAAYTTPFFARTFFGLGNETVLQALQSLVCFYHLQGGILVANSYL